MRGFDLMSDSIPREKRFSDKQLDNLVEKIRDSNRPEPVFTEPYLEEIYREIKQWYQGWPLTQAHMKHICFIVREKVEPLLVKGEKNKHET